MTPDADTPEARLDSLGITLPPVPDAVAKYIGVVTVDNLAFVSGHGPVENGELAYIGRLGENMDVATGQQAACNVALNMLATLQDELGQLNRIERVVKLLVMVNSAPDFQEQPAVANGATDLFVDAFGEARAVSARSAVGMAVLPFGISVEIEGIFQIRR